MRSQVYISQRAFPFNSSLPMKYEKSGGAFPLPPTHRELHLKVDLRESLLVQHREVQMYDGRIPARTSPCFTLGVKKRPELGRH